MTEKSRFILGRQGIEGRQVQLVPVPGIGIHVHIPGIERRQVLEEMRSLAGIHPEIRQGTLHQGLCL